MTTAFKATKTDKLMTDNGQLAYLEAMDIDVWRLRLGQVVTSNETNKTPGIKLGPGSGGVLLLCTDPEYSSSRLANDVVRSLGGVPVWAWPQCDDSGVELVDAVDEHLFTTVAIFGQQLADSFFTGHLPKNLNAAKLVLLPSMEDILNCAEARRLLWNTLCNTGMVSAN